LTSGRRAECRRWVNAVLEQIDDRDHPRVVAPLLRALIQTATGPEVLALAERATSVFESIGDRLGVALLQSHVAMMRRRHGFIEEANAAIERASTIFAVGDLPRLMPYTAFLHNRIEVRLEQGRYEEALADIEDGIAILQSLGDGDALLFRALRAELDFIMGETEAAISRLEDTIERSLKASSPYARLMQELYAKLAIYRIFAGLDDSAYQAGRQAIQMTKNVGDESRIIALYAMALLAASRGQAPRAARLLGALDARFADMYRVEAFSGHVQRRSHALLAEMLRRALAPEELEMFTAGGRSMTFDMAVAEASLV
jgi:tetratricopeptide (TPR) repeat protein